MKFHKFTIKSNFWKRKFFVFDEDDNLRYSFVPSGFWSYNSFLLLDGNEELLRLKSSMFYSRGEIFQKNRLIAAFQTAPFSGKLTIQLFDGNHEITISPNIFKRRYEINQISGRSLGVVSISSWKGTLGVVLEEDAPINELLMLILFRYILDANNG